MAVHFPGRIWLLLLLLANAGAADARDWSNEDELSSLPLEDYAAALSIDLSGHAPGAFHAAKVLFDRVQQESATQYYLTACRLMVTAHYLSGDTGSGMNTARYCLEDLQPGLSVSETLQIQGIIAALHLTQGEPVEAIQLFEQVLSSNTSDVPPAALRGIRSNYAAALKSSGESLRPVIIMADLLNEALADDDIREQLKLGNNLVVMLEEQGLYSEAMFWIDEVSEAAQSLPEDNVTLSLQLHEMQIRGILGEQESAIKDLRQFVAQYEGRVPLLMGNAHEYLADLLLETDAPTQAMDHATRAVALLEMIPMERFDAELTLARALLATDQLTSAENLLTELAEVRDALQVHSKELLNSLELQLALAKTGSAALTAQFDQFSESRRQIEQLRQGQQSRYYASQLEAARQARRLEDLEQQQEDAAIQQRYRELIMVSIVLGIMVFFLLAYMGRRRRLDADFREKQATLTSELEQEVKTQSAALAKREHHEALGQLTRNVANDLNNLLQVIVFNNDKLKSEVGRDNASSLLNSSNEALTAARGVVARLLAYARQQHLDQEPLGAYEYLHSTRPLLQTALPKNISLECVNHLPDHLGFEVDRAQLTAALINLLNNSVAAISGAGKIRLEFSLVKHRADDSDWDLSPGPYVQVTVSDDGSGMGEEEVRRAIEPFYTTRKSASGDASGSGLGLSSVFGFVRQSGGDLTITSALNKGTSVKMRFPKVSLPLTPSVNTPTGTLDLSGLSVMLLESESALVTTLRAMLDSLGLLVTVEESSDAAMARLSADPQGTGLLICNSGLFMAEEPTNMSERVPSEHPTLPVLLISGCSEATPMDWLQLQTPFTEDELRAAIVEVMAEQRGGD